MMRFGIKDLVMNVAYLTIGTFSTTVALLGGCAVYGEVVEPWLKKKIKESQE